MLGVEEEVKIEGIHFTQCGLSHPDVLKRVLHTISSWKMTGYPEALERQDLHKLV